jgi:hypothetical protein
MATDEPHQPAFPNSQACSQCRTALAYWWSHHQAGVTADLKLAWPSKVSGSLLRGISPKTVEGLGSEVSPPILLRRDFGERGPRKLSDTGTERAQAKRRQRSRKDSPRSSSVNVDKGERRSGGVSPTSMQVRACSYSPRWKAAIALLAAAFCHSSGL